MEFKILTTLSTYDENRKENDTTYGERLVMEQESILLSKGIDDSAYLLLRKGKYFITTISDAIQSLSLKDGADLVEFSNGNIGYVGYYNGFSLEENHFEIICKADDKSLLEKYGDEFDYQDSKELFDDRLWSFDWDKSLYADDLVDYLNQKGE